MEVKIVTFPETRIALITHLGAPQDEHATARKLIAWKLEQGLRDPERFRSYGLHYADFNAVDPAEYRVDFCLSIEEDIEPDSRGIVQGLIPSQRCAVARDIGSRAQNKAAHFLFYEWLPNSQEQLSGQPLIFHYVNVGPNIPESEQITDVYLPLE